MKSLSAPKVENFLGNMFSFPRIGSAFSQVGQGSSCHPQREWYSAGFWFVCLPSTSTLMGVPLYGTSYFSLATEDSLFLMSDYKYVLV